MFFVAEEADAINESERFSPITISYTESTSDYVSPLPVCATDSMKSITERVLRMDSTDRLKFLGEMFSIAEDEDVYVNTDFLALPLKAMKQLAHSGRGNLLYGLCRGLGTQREDGSDSVFPSKRVVTGMI